MRIFYVIYVHDEPFRTVLNGIRVLANPKEKHSAHITVQGPLSRRHSQSKLEDLNSKVRDTEILVGSVGNFFSFNQNTVFLKCDSPALPAVWRKSHYGYNPHLTLYDGEHRQLADEIFSILRFHPIQFLFSVKDGLEPLIVNGQRDFYLSYNIDYALLESYAECRLNNEVISSITSARRLDIIERLASSLVQEYPVQAAL